MAAENPVAFTAYLGRKPHAVEVLDRLARTCGIRVAEFNAIDLNLPQDSPCHAGIDPLPLLAQADLGLLLDTDVPFVPQSARRAGAIDWIQIDIDPLKSDFPMWDLRPTCGSRATAQSSYGRCWTRSKRAPTTLIASG
jgi:acetolactate synthase-1/2/3 large subunit